MATRPGDTLRATLLCALTLAGAAGCGGPTAQPAASPTPPPRASAPTRSSARTAGWVLVAVGAHAAAIAAGTSVMMLHEDGVRSDGCGPDRVCNSEGSARTTGCGTSGPGTPARGSSRPPPRAAACSSSCRAEPTARRSASAPGAGARS
ncbi:MAG: hypothetical protein KF850_37645 [Labilithrix sp.]|nr:hypothetical protein [Labilithrix sp.]